MPYIHFVMQYIIVGTNWYQRLCIAWQNVCKAWFAFGAKFSFATKITPDVPKEINASPSFITPMPHAAAALSPAPLTTITFLERPF